MDSSKANYKSLFWTEKGDGLAALKDTQKKSYQDKLYQVVGFTFTPFKQTTVDPTKDPDFPKGLSISPNCNQFWHPRAAKEEGGRGHGRGRSQAGCHRHHRHPDSPEMLVWHFKDKRLAPMQVVQERMDKTYSYLSLFYPENAKVVRLADDTLRQVTLSPENKFAIGRDSAPYDL